MSLVPLVAIVALVALVAGLVWFMNRADADRARAKLATDALWVEQTLRFQMSVDEDMLVRLALDEAGGTARDVLIARARVHVSANPEVLSILWIDAEGRPIEAVPGGPTAEEAALARQILASGAVSSRPVYGGVTGGRVSMAVHAAPGEGVILATVSLPMMLDRHLPWWIAEQYAVRISDTSGTLAERMRRQVADGSPAHAISFDPPLRGTMLEINAYDRPPAFGNAVIFAAIAALAAFAILALFALHRNANRRRAAELRLQGEMAFRRSMEESLTVGLRAKDHDGRILYVNSAFCRLVGLPSELLVGHGPPMPYWAPDMLEETLQRQQALAANGAKPQSFETRFRRGDGTEIDVQVYEAPLIDAQGRHRGWMGSVIDITEAKSAARTARAHDESLARTSRLVTLGEMASTLAHELNQPLAAIASYAAGGLNLIDRGDADPAMIRGALEKLALQARRAGLIIRRIQDFVKKREPRLQPLALEEVLTDAMSFLAADAREMRVRLRADLADAPPVMADRILIEQLLINLIRNGMEAMAGAGMTGGELTVSLRSEDNGQAALIEIADEGPGIPEQLAGRLFDPFTSTKPQGMGMGLNICRSIVELHRGRLGHRPGPAGGTVFSVTLAAASARPDEGDAAA